MNSFWTSEKISQLRSLVDTKSTKELTLIFNTTYNSIASVMTRQKIKRKVHPNRKEIIYKIDSNGCWICTSHSKDDFGYPYYFFEGKLIRMSRYMYQKHKGTIPNNLIIRHTCDNSSCINPDHLTIGTKKDNMQDAVLRERNIRGERVHTNKLTEEQVREIKKLLQNKYRGYITDIAKMFNVTLECISSIKAGHNWKHIT
jgi:hypothetical protein